MAQVRPKDIMKEVIAGLETLPEERLEGVRDFVEFLKQKSGQPARGSAEALLQSFDTWEGSPGELEHLVEEIYEARHQEEG